MLLLTNRIKQSGWMDGKAILMIRLHKRVTSVLTIPFAGFSKTNCMLERPKWQETIGNYNQSKKKRSSVKPPVNTFPRKSISP